MTETESDRQTATAFWLGIVLGAACAMLLLVATVPRAHAGAICSVMYRPDARCVLPDYLQDYRRDLHGQADEPQADELCLRRGKVVPCNQPSPDDLNRRIGERR